MQYRNLGTSGLKVSVIGLGTNQFGGKVDEKSVLEIITAAIDSGINFIDTADTYQDGNSEITIGKAIKGKRDKVLIATKVFSKMGEGPNDKGTSRKHIMDGVEASLKRLDIEYIDLYQMHRWDDTTPIEETMRSLDDLITQGKVRYIGSSAFDAWKLTHANHIAEMRGWNKFVSEQPHYHMLERTIEKTTMPACEYFGIGILPYFPLAGGFLIGKYQRGESAPEGSRGEKSPYVQKYMTDKNFDILDKLTEFANDREKSMGALAHAWLMSQPQISSVISGATKVNHVIQNAKAGDWHLSQEELSDVNKILDNEK